MKPMRVCMSYEDHNDNTNEQGTSPELSLTPYQASGQALDYLI